MESPLSYFSELKDPRVVRTLEHSLEDILFIAIASVICGAESWYGMEEFGKAKEEWLKTFLRLPGGIPSHDTFNRVFSALEPEELEKSFVGRTQSVTGLAEGEIVAIDDLSLIEQAGEWEGLKCLVKVESVRYFKCSGKEEKDTRLYITSLEADAQVINNAVRFH